MTGLGVHQARSIFLFGAVFALGCFFGHFLPLFPRELTPSKNRVRVDELLHNPKKKVQVVVFIPSPLQNSERRRLVQRQFLRENWSTDEVVILWIVGTKTGDRLEHDLNTSSIYNEPGMTTANVVETSCRDYGDEFNNPNGTSATTCKFYEAIKHIHANFIASFVWRGADDAYLNLKLFFKLVPTLPKNATWLGHLKDQQRSWDLILSNQPKLRDLYGLEKFSTLFMLGMGFVFTWDIVILIASWNIPPYLTWCEDVVVGHWLHFFSIQRLSRPDLFINRAGSIANKWPLDGTYGNLSVLLVHYIEPQDWENIHPDGSIYIPCPKNGHC